MPYKDELANKLREEALPYIWTGKPIIVERSAHSMRDLADSMEFSKDRLVSKFIKGREGEVRAGAGAVKGVGVGFRRGLDIEFGPSDYELVSFFRHPREVEMGTGKGLGLQALLDVVEDLYSTGASRLIVTVGPGSSRLYRKLGFKKVGKEYFLEGSTPVYALSRTGMKVLLGKYGR